MKIVGLRRDGVLFVTAGSGVAVMLKGDRVTPPLDALTVDRLGPWDLGGYDVAVLVAARGAGGTRPRAGCADDDFALDKDEHGYGSTHRTNAAVRSRRRRACSARLSKALGIEKKEPAKLKEKSPEEKAADEKLRAHHAKQFAKQEAAKAVREKAAADLEAAKPQEQRDAEADDKSSADLYKSILDTAHSQASRTPAGQAPSAAGPRDTG